MNLTNVLSKDYYARFLDEFEYTEDAKTALLLVLDRILASKECESKLNDALAKYEDEKSPFPDILKEARGVLSEYGISAFGGAHVFVAHLFSRLREVYVRFGIPDEIFVASVTDLRYKTTECKLVEGEYGTFVADWYRGFFEMRIFALGRLQFDKRPLAVDCTVDGVELTADTPSVYIHIPRNEEPLSPEAAHASYALAKEFFKKYFPEIFIGDKLVFSCSSWLLFEEHRRILKPTANIIHFMNDFTIVKTYLSDGYKGVWRLFDTKYCDDPDALPTDSSLRRAYVQMIKEGKPIGGAQGVFLL